MTDLPLTLACADYARLMPLATGIVRPEGIDLTLLLGRGGGWPERAEMLRRAMQDPSVQGGEQSMAGHLIRLDRGDKSFVGLPIFPLRNFTARDLYVRKDGPIRTAADLAGARIGMYGWANSGSIWYRHFLRYLGVDLASIENTIQKRRLPNRQLKARHKLLAAYSDRLRDPGFDTPLPRVSAS